MGTVNVTYHRMIIIGSLVITGVVLLVAAGVGGSYLLALAALDNHNDLSIQQACDHWRWQYAAAAEDHETHLQAADAETLGQLRCKR